MATKTSDPKTTGVRSGGKRVRPEDGKTSVQADTLNRAIGDVKYIRDLMDASHDFFVSGWSGVAAGVVTTVGVVLTAWIISHPERWDISPTLWTLWIIIGVLLLASDVLFFVKRSREVARPVFSPLLAKVGFAELLMGGQGLILTLIFIKTGTPEYIPGAWLLTFGTTLTALGLFIPGGLWVLGLVSLAASIAAFVIPSGGLWCAGFAGAAMCLWGAAYLITRGK
jgi:hypothetical protein